MFAWLKRTFLRLLHKERCSRRLALSLCLGLYIAFSPFVGLHTLMVFIFAWIFALNSALLLAISCGINNPWTMLPIYATDHLVGDWLFYWFGIDGSYFNPEWAHSLSQTVSYYTGLQGISVASFVVGGNLLALAVSIVMYPIARYFFARFIARRSVSS